MVSTQMDETDVIYGSEEKLRKAIKEVEERFKPEMISVITGCVPEITGENVGGLIEEMKKQVSCPLLYVPSGGIVGVQHEGVEEAIVALVDHIMEPPREKKRRSVNLMGHIRPVVSCRLEEIRLLNKIGLEVNAVIPGDSTVEEIRRAPAAELNVLRCESSAEPACQRMEEKFGVPYIATPPPFGVTLTSRWLRKIAQFFGGDVEERAEKVIEEEEKRAWAATEEYRRFLKGRPCEIEAGPSRFVAMIGLANDLGLKVLYSETHTVHERTERYLQEVLEACKLDYQPYTARDPYLTPQQLSEIVRIKEHLRGGLTFCSDGNQSCVRDVAQQVIMGYEFPHEGYTGFINFARQCYVKRRTPLLRYIEDIVSNPPNARLPPIRGE
jgi:nitrogenase molybdenum-iron protein alpha/beta subunit